MLMRQYRGASKLEWNVNTVPSLVIYEYWASKLSTSLTQGSRPGEDEYNDKINSVFLINNNKHTIASSKRNEMKRLKHALQSQEEM